MFLKRFSRHFILSFFCGAIALVAVPSNAATIIMNNGDRLSGVIVRTDESRVIIATPYGTFPVLLSGVDKMFAGEAPPAKVNAAGRGVFEKSLVFHQDSVGQSNVVGLDKAPESTPKKKAQNKMLWGAKVKGRANLGASLQTGNSDKSSINADAEVSLRWTENRFVLKTEYNRSEDEGDITVDNKALEAQYDVFFREDWFMNTSLGFEQNNIQELDLRSEVGIGIGHQVYEQDDLNLKYIFGPQYVHENFSNQSSEDSIAANWAFDYDQKFYDEAFQVFHGHDITVPTDATDAFFIESKTGVRLPLLKGVVGTAEVQFDWDNDPAPGTTEDDTIYSLKLGYEW